tara:strand:- start:182 stop:379 length:198 start_codon:yes stop_codon:yes gene_type:complete
MVKLIVFSVLLNAGDSNIYVTVATEPIKAIEGSLFNEYDWQWVIEARRRGGKRDKGRKRGGNGLR